MGFSITLACSSQAAVIVNESFDYTAGSTSNDADAGLNSGNGLPLTNVGGDPSGTGTGLRNNWATGTITSGGLTYGNLQTSGNAYLVTGSNDVGTGNNPWIYRNMTTDPYASLRVGGVSSGNLGADGTTIWFSMLYQVSSIPTNNNADRAIVQLVGTNRFAIGLNNSSSNADKFSIGNSAGASNFSSVSATAGETYFLVARLDSVAGNDTMSLWVNPTIGVTLGTADATISGRSPPRSITCSSPKPRAAAGPFQPPSAMASSLLSRSGKPIPTPTLTCASACPHVLPGSN